MKASEDAKRQRDLKKFGKKVQIEKLQERQKKKTEDMEKIKMLKRSKEICQMKERSNMLGTQLIMNRLFRAKGS